MTQRIVELPQNFCIRVASGNGCMATCCSQYNNTRWLEGLRDGTYPLHGAIGLNWSAPTAKHTALTTPSQRKSGVQQKEYGSGFESSMLLGDVLAWTMGEFTVLVKGSYKEWMQPRRLTEGLHPRAPGGQKGPGSAINGVWRLGCAIIDYDGLPGLL